MCVRIVFFLYLVGIKREPTESMISFPKNVTIISNNFSQQWHSLSSVLAQYYTHIACMCVQASVINSIFRSLLIFHLLLVVMNKNHNHSNNQLKMAD